jgi:hypothetical protein
MLLSGIVLALNAYSKSAPKDIILRHLQICWLFVRIVGDSHFMYGAIVVAVVMMLLLETTYFFSLSPKEG